MVSSFAYEIVRERDCQASKAYMSDLTIRSYYNMLVLGINIYTSHFTIREHLGS